ncbi:MAG: hypothetical protein HY814_05270 [Candidatus Riflebacteria bacterium]|nr:hypothetical protein [Candidatus Riflebacteria bacterium]
MTHGARVWTVLLAILVVVPPQRAAAAASGAVPAVAGQGTPGASAAATLLEREPPFVSVKGFALGEGRIGLADLTLARPRPPSNDGPPTGPPPLTGSVVLEGREYLLRNVRLTFVPRPAAAVRETVPGSPRVPGLLASGRTILVNADVVAPFSRAGAPASMTAHLLRTAPTVGSFAARVEPRISIRYRVRARSVPFLTGTLHLEKGGDWRVMGRLSAGPAAGVPRPAAVTGR